MAVRDDYQFTKSVVLRLLNDFYESQTGQRAPISAATNFLYETKYKERKDKDYEVLQWFEPNDDRIEACETVCRIKSIKRISDEKILSVGDTLYKSEEIVGIIKHGYDIAIITTDKSNENFNLGSRLLHQIKYNT